LILELLQKNTLSSKNGIFNYAKLCFDVNVLKTI
jgi:hypothetical protein